MLIIECSQGCYGR